MRGTATNHLVSVESVNSLADGGRRGRPHAVHKQTVGPHLCENASNSQRICGRNNATKAEACGGGGEKTAEGGRGDGCAAQALDPKKK
jgi:hypothetical protein